MNKLKPIVIATLLNLLDLIGLVTFITPLAVAIMVYLDKDWWPLLTPDVFGYDLSVPAVAEIEEAYGPAAAEIYWLGFRNRLHGLDFKFATPAAEVWGFGPGKWSDSAGYWYTVTPFFGGRFVWKSGYRQYTVAGIRYNVPVFGPTRA